MVTRGMMSIDWKEILRYEEGQLFWKEAPSYRIAAGAVAGNKTGPGYWQVCYKGRFYKLHNIVWLMHNSVIPDGTVVDHKDRNKDNNCIDNLRLLTNSLNSFNRGVQSNNKLGIKGVSKTGNRFVAYIKENGKTKNLGYYNTAEEASSVYQKALSERFNEFH